MGARTVPAAAAACLIALALTSGGSRAGDTADGELTLFLAGDAIITQPWSADRDPGFLALVDEIRAADVAIVNLEMLFHEYKGYAQADAGGGYVAAPPEVAAELAWAGIDLVADANNHTFDYGSTGVLENLDNVTRAGLVLAGAGKDLQGARAPAYRRHPDGVVALVATASSFVPYGRASRSRPDMPGRPGLNPLATTVGPRGLYVEAPDPVVRALRGAADLLGLPQYRLDSEWSKLLGVPVRSGGFGLRRGRRIDPKDLEGNLASVREAATEADLVVFSIHAHEREGRWLTELAHRVIDAGADVFFAHGPHRILGIEIYAGKPILYGPGDFVFQPEQAERFPSETYEAYGLGDTATPEDVRRAAVARKRFFAEREPWEGFAAVLRVGGGELREVRLLPLDLRFDARPPLRGMPRYADEALAERIIDQVAAASRPYGTMIRYLDGERVGAVDLD